MKFSNPANGHTEQVTFSARFGVFFLGGVYLGLKGLWGHALLWFALVLPLSYVDGGGWAVSPLPGWPILALPIGLVYALLIPGILRNNYLHKGWVIVE